MLSSELRDRIAELKRSAMGKRRVVADTSEFDVSAIEDDSLERYELPPPSVIPKATASDARIRLTLDEIASGREQHTPPGRFFLIDESVDGLLPRRGPELSRRFAKVLAETRGKSVVPHDEHETFGALTSTPDDALVFVDIEATGFTPGTPLFLVGLMVLEDGDLRIRQLLARDYAEEGALLYYLWKSLEGVQTVVSFNGKTYDLPYIRDRMVFHGYRMPGPLAHIDLLHEGRRRYKDRLVNCKLQTLERAICGRGRYGDIPGAEIPDAYHDFVRTGNAVDVRDILHHNALDLVTMVEVVLFILEGRTL